MAPGEIVINNYLRRLDTLTGIWYLSPMTEKYAVDVIAPTEIIDRHTGEVIVVENIEEVPGQDDKLLFDAYFKETGTDWTRTLDYDSIVKVVDTH
jgi:hypothetical protein